MKRKISSVLVPNMLKCSVLAGSLILGGCFAQTIQHGYVVSPEALQQVPVGSSEEQVLLALGSPSTVENYGGRAYYYISQKARKVAAFAKPRMIDQRVLVVYFDSDDTVERIADYGLNDGKVFDYLTRTTPTAGDDTTFLTQILSSATGANAARNALGGF